MNRPLTIVALLPTLTNAHGDAENADVAVRRLRWRGLEAQLLRVNSADEWPEEVDLLVLGGPTDSECVAAARALQPLKECLVAALEDGVPVLAVAAGWELLGDGLDLADGTGIAGLGVLPGRGRLRGERIADDLVVDGGLGRLVGFENHDRDIVVDAEHDALGSIVIGHGRGDGREGLVLGNAIATRLHGPVLARNPRLADHLLELAVHRRGADLPEADERTAQVDEYARQTRLRTLRDHRLDDHA